MSCIFIHLISIQHLYNIYTTSILCGYKMIRSVQVNVRLSESEYRRAADASVFLDVSMSQVCRKALRDLAKEAISKGWKPDVIIEIQGVK